MSGLWFWGLGVFEDVLAFWVGWFAFGGGGVMDGALWR